MANEIDDLYDILLLLCFDAWLVSALLMRALCDLSSIMLCRLEQMQIGYTIRFE
jgi:hypothetical protein